MDAPIRTASATIVGNLVCAETLIDSDSNEQSRIARKANAVRRRLSIVGHWGLGGAEAARWPASERRSEKGCVRESSKAVSPTIGIRPIIDMNKSSPRRVSQPSPMPWFKRTVDLTDRHPADVKIDGVPLKVPTA